MSFYKSSSVFKNLQLDGSQIYFLKSKRGTRVSFANNMLKLYPKFVRNKLSNLVMVNERWIEFLVLLRKKTCMDRRTISMRKVMYVAYNYNKIFTF